MVEAGEEFGPLGGVAEVGGAFDAGTGPHEDGVGSGRAVARAARAVGEDGDDALRMREDEGAVLAGALPGFRVCVERNHTKDHCNKGPCTASLVWNVRLDFGALACGFLGLGDADSDWAGWIGVCRSVGGRCCAGGGYEVSGYDADV